MTRRFDIEQIRRVVRGRWVTLPGLWRGKSSAGASLTAREKLPLMVEGVCTDSRQANPGEVFFAIKGEKFDGHDFLPAAAEGGCIAAIVDGDISVNRETKERFPAGIIAVTDTTTALGDLAEYCRKRLTATVVAVTGSNGKTTVKEMIHHILSKHMKGSAAKASFNNAVGVPLTLLDARSDDAYVICEAGTNHPGEMARLARIIKPDIAVITSVHETHLEGLGDIEHVAIEKSALLCGLSPHGLVVAWADSEPLKKALHGYDAKVVWFGQDGSADLRLTGYKPVIGGGRFQLNGRFWVELVVPGLHNALNALAAIAVAQKFGIAPAVSARDLKDYHGTKMRLEVIKHGGITIINDAYNSNPASLRAGVAAMESFRGKRRVVVVGDMLELGPASEQLHRRAGETIAAMGVGLIVGIGALGRYIADGAENVGGVITERIGSVEEACKVLPSMLKRGDVVLIKGSRRMEMERLVEPIEKAFRPKRRAGKTYSRKVRTC